MLEYAQKLTKRDASGKVTQWGVQIPSSGFPYWLFQALAIENGVNLMNAAGTETYYDKPEVIEALQYWVDLVKKYKVHPEGIVDWGTTPKDFFEKKMAMMWTTTGNLTNVRTNAKFDFGVAMLPAGKQRGSPTGGGNFYLFKKSTPAQQQAAFRFIKWITTPERAAQWGIDTGYVAVRADAWETPAMKQYVAGIPGCGRRARPASVRQGRAVDARQPARDPGVERRAAGGAHRHQDGRAGDEGRAARSGAVAAPVQEVSGAQGESWQRAARDDPWHRNGSTAGCSCCRPRRCSRSSRTTRRSPPCGTASCRRRRASRPAVWVGLDNYRQLADDPIFWQALVNNLWFAVGTIPASIALALLMAVWVNDRVPGRGFLRLAYFTPTILPMIAVANIWLFFYTPEYGLLEKALAVFGAGTHNWLGSKNSALVCLMVVTVWKEAGFFMIFYLAALQSMSPHLAEAAAIEGASRGYFFRRVTFPLLMPTTLFVLVNAVINAFRLVDHVVVMTRGGPDNATSLLLYYIYEIGFRYWDSAYAAALTMVLLALLGAVALAQFWFLERKVHYQ